MRKTSRCVSTPARPTNTALWTREFLAQHEVEKLIEVTKRNRSGRLDTRTTFLTQLNRRINCAPPIALGARPTSKRRRWRACSPENFGRCGVALDRKPPLEALCGSGRGRCRSPRWSRPTRPCCFRTDGYLLDGGLSLAGRQVEVPFRPLQQGAFGVSNRAADFRLRRHCVQPPRFALPFWAVGPLAQDQEPSRPRGAARRKKIGQQAPGR